MPLQEPTSKRLRELPRRVGTRRVRLRDRGRWQGGDDRGPPTGCFAPMVTKNTVISQSPRRRRSSSSRLCARGMWGVTDPMMVVHRNRGSRPPCWLARNSPHALLPTPLISERDDVLGGHNTACLQLPRELRDHAPFAGVFSSVSRRWASVGSMRHADDVVPFLRRERGAG